MKASLLLLPVVIIIMWDFPATKYSYHFVIENLQEVLE